MNYAEAIYQHSLKLPETAAREVLDFIEFLEQRHALRSVVATTLQAEKRQAALQQLASVRIHWQGKPIPERGQLYDEARG